MERWLGWCCPSGLTPPPHLSLPKGVRRRECLGHSQTDSSSGAGSSSLPFSLASRHLRRGYGMQRDSPSHQSRHPHFLLKKEGSPAEYTPHGCNLTEVKL